MRVNGNPARNYFLTTTRLGFSSWLPGDLPLALELWGNAEVSALIGGPFTPGQVEARLNSEIACAAEHGVQYWPIFLLDDGRHAGCAGLRPYRIDQQMYELGFHLCSDQWGRGLAEEAGRAVVAFAFKNLGARALFAGHHPANAASRRILEKLGFRFTHEELYPPTGLQHPSYLLTRADYLRI